MNLRSSPRYGMLIMIAAMLILPSIDAIAKFLSDQVSAGQVVWGRFLFQTLLMSAILIAMRFWHKKRGLDHEPSLRSKGDRPSLNALWGLTWPQLVRGFLLATATLFFFAALAKLPLTDAIAIFFVEPLLITLVAPFFLNETVGWRRLAAVCVGLLGALIVVRPSYALFGVHALYPLATAVIFTFYMIMSRKYSSGDPLNMQLGAGIGGLITMTAALALGTSVEISVLSTITLNATQWGWLVLLGFIAAIGHLMIVIALKFVDASIIAPFQYVEILMATTLGYVLFDDWPGPLVWLGVTLIVGSGLYIFHRESKLAA